jgi:hypothetical protein
VGNEKNITWDQLREKYVDGSTEGMVNEYRILHDKLWKMEKLFDTN